jgi:hypothetical protein
MIPILIPGTILASLTLGRVFLSSPCLAAVIGPWEREESQRGSRPQPNTRHGFHEFHEI